MENFDQSLRLDVNFVDRQSGTNTMDWISSFDTKPDLKLISKSGVFLWGTNRLAEWIHCDDLEVAAEIVPGYRVFNRECCDSPQDRQDGYAKISYGRQTFRALPIVWLEVAAEGFEMGDQVEVKSDYGKRQPRLARISEKKWNRYSQRIEYSLSGVELNYRRVYLADELQPALKLASAASSLLPDVV